MNQPTRTLGHWGLLILLSLIWGSSFVLMKKGMFADDGSSTLSAYQVAALRMLSAGLVLLPLAIKGLRTVSKEKFAPILWSAFLGSFFPAFLFCIAETKIDSSLAGFLNALTPIFTIIIGVLFYGSKFNGNKILGVALAFTGMVILFLAGGNMHFENLAFTSFVLVATIFYGINVNIANAHLRDMPSQLTAALAFGFLIPPSLLVLIFTGYFNLPLSSHSYLISSGATALLGIAGTALATIIFYSLLKKAGALFASMVTYGIPFIALGWGLATGENIGLYHVLGLGVILFGVYRTNRS
jgi:hypothetical protein